MPTNTRSLEERLSCHPELHEKIEQLWGVVESTDDDLARTGGGLNLLHGMNIQPKFNAVDQ